MKNILLLSTISILLFSCSSDKTGEQSSDENVKERVKAVKSKDSLQKIADSLDKEFEKL